MKTLIDRVLAARKALLEAELALLLGTGWKQSGSVWTHPSWGTTWQEAAVRETWIRLRQSGELPG